MRGLRPQPAALPGLQPTPLLRYTTSPPQPPVATFQTPASFAPQSPLAVTLPRPCCASCCSPAGERHTCVASTRAPIHSACPALLFLARCPALTPQLASLCPAPVAPSAPRALQRSAHPKAPPPLAPPLHRSTQPAPAHNPCRPPCAQRRASGQALHAPCAASFLHRISWLLLALARLLRGKASCRDAQDGGRCEG